MNFCSFVVKNFGEKIKTQFSLSVSISGDILTITNGGYFCAQVDEDPEGSCEVTVGVNETGLFSLLQDARMEYRNSVGKKAIKIRYLQLDISPKKNEKE